MGGGIGMGNTCKPMAVSFQCMTKFTTNKKKEKRKKQTASFYKFRAFHERIQVLTLTLQQEEAKCTKLKTKVLQEEIFQGWIFW